MTDELHEFDPDYVVHPGETLREWHEYTIKEMWPLEQLFGIFGIEPSPEDVLSGKAELDDDTCARLARMTGVPHQLWVNLERNFRTGLAAGKHWDPASDAVKPWTQTVVPEEER